MSSDVAPPTEGTVQPSDASASTKPAETTSEVMKSEAAGPEAPPAGELLDRESTQPLSPDDEPATGFGLASAPTGRRVRARLARFNAPWQSTQVSEVLEPLIATHRASHPKADGRALQRAFDVAARWHSGQYRKSGDPYITHPLAVATILANLGMDTTTLVAALLHDTIEDTDYGLEQMKTDFGPEVALLVDGVTKLDRVKLGDAAKAETIRKMVVAMAKDPRVLVIKLADRLHNMRTLTFLPRAKQEQKAKETLEILAPLAHRLGMNTIKWELEDLAFGTLFPKRFEEINRLIGEHQPQREALLRQVTNRVQLDLKSAKIKAETTGRPKHLYSIYQKMIVRGRDFNDIYDLVG
ncbi:MAG: HD domain-containing protein, partial [Actinoplanes sp.]